MRQLLWWMVCAGCVAQESPVEDGPAFVPYTPDATVPDPTTDRLCPDALAPEAASDKVFIDCALEGATFADPNVVGPDPLTAMVWNMERGLKLDDQLAAFADGSVPMPDILLVSELDRGCSRSDGRNVPRELAEALALNYVFAVEFVELPRTSGSGGAIDTPCEHGNAVMSRFPLGNVGQMRHADHLSWYLDPSTSDGTGEPRLGGRIAVLADTLIGDRQVRLASLHFESKPIPIDVQQGQAEELAAWADASPIPILVGGDTNAPGYTGDMFADHGPDEVNDGTIRPFLDAGLVDAHASLAAADRATRSGLIIDLLMARDLTTADAAVCEGAVCDGLSDHRAVWATLGRAE